MSSDPVVPHNVPLDVENAQEGTYSALETNRELKDAVGIRAGRTERLLEREYRDSRPLGEIPGSPSPRLRETAETVGSAFGRAVNRARELPHRLAEMKQRFTVIRGRAREEAAIAAENVGETAQQKFQRVRTSAHDYPIQFILGTGAVCFALGAVLRIWRSDRHG